MRRAMRWQGLVAGAALFAAAEGAEVRIAGSDLLGAEFVRAALGFGARHGQKITLALDGSRRGIEELKAGRADVALLVENPAEPGPGSDFVTAPVAYHAALVIAPAGCPLRQITLPQLARVFGAAASPLPATWREAGATDTWAAAQLVPVIPGAGGGLIADLFRHVALAGGEFKPATRSYATPDELQLHAGGEAKVLAVIANGRECPGGMKVLAVSPQATQPAVLPAPEHLRSGAYPLRLPLAVAFRRGRGAELAATLRFLMGDTAAGVFERANLIPLSAEAKAQELRRLETL